MRDNGLTAASYAPAGEVDPDLADVVLASLAEAGIAAYVKPSIGRDVMYVDADELERGKDIVRRAGDDAEFAALVAQLELEDDPDAEHPWPAAEDVDPAADGGGTTKAPAASDAVRAADEAEAERVRRAEAEPVEEHEHYVPPEPAPGPRLDWISRLAWTGLLGGPLVLVLAAATNWGRGSYLLVLALLGFVAGFLTLVIRMKDKPPADGSGDDGAVV
ncbi:MAG TPA: hypothetical protein VEK80_12385 [Kribbellaceae bacterium]|nr:hypothetical protein [Kribbellaceae bacterium]